jgi:hypothetical protein
VVVNEKDAAELFLVLVQTGSITHTLVGGRSPSLAAQVVGEAAELEVDDVPHGTIVELTRAAVDYVEYQFGRSPRPGWLP